MSNVGQKNLNSKIRLPALKHVTVAISGCRRLRCQLMPMTTFYPRWEPLVSNRSLQVHMRTPKSAPFAYEILGVVENLEKAKWTFWVEVMLSHRVENSWWLPSCSHSLLYVVIYTLLTYTGPFLRCILVLFFSWRGKNVYHTLSLFFFHVYLVP